MDRMADPFEGVVSVHQEDAVVGHGSRVGLEGLELGVEGEDPAMGMGTADRNAEQLAREDVRGAVAAAGIGGAAGGEAAVDSLRAICYRTDEIASARPLTK